MAGTLFGEITVMLECYFSWQAQFGELALSILGEVAVMLESHFSWQMQRSFISSFVALVTFLFCIAALYWMFHGLPLSNIGVEVTLALHHIGSSAYCSGRFMCYDYQNLNVVVTSQSGARNTL